ncbi:unnamed protein product [Owenia fusiformis]|uniref:Carbohydrate sulfotransferase n=1 Tax=Owenia fusiformis TaxID=6347 RepID=A0A8J1XZU3_OWEFU|nr:unnamed protein product [Owenia fusiformis]
MLNTTRAFCSIRILILCSIGVLIFQVFILHQIFFSKMNNPNGEKQRTGIDGRAGHFERVNIEPNKNNRQNKQVVVQPHGEILEERKRQVEKICDTLTKNALLNSSLDPKEYYGHIYVDPMKKILYCYTPKVASTHWREILTANFYNMPIEELTVNITGGDWKRWYKGHILTPLGKIAPNKRQYIIDTYYKFMFTRHPLDRFYSTWKNKFMETNDSYYREHFGSVILKKYRENATIKDLYEGEGVRFEEFIKFITFEGIRFRDEHWQSFFELCKPCQIHYDIIGNFETLSEDTNYVIEKTNLSKYQFPQVISKSTYNRQTLYENIYKPDLIQLYKRFRLDFDMFKYTMQLS